MFVHLTNEKNRNSIIRDGIKQEKIHYEDVSRGVFCMPVISDFYATHQWLREMKMSNSANNIIAIYFKIPDDESVFYGQFNGEMTKTTAAAAHKIFDELEDKMGFQVIVQRKILKSEITKVKNLPQTIGWRHFPKAHERKRCLCPACLWRGAYGATRTKEAEMSRLFKDLRNANEPLDIANALNEIAYPDFTGAKIQNRNDEELLVKLSESEDPGIKEIAIHCISQFCGGKYFDYYLTTLYATNDLGVADSCLSALFQVKGDDVLDMLELEKCSEEKKKLIDEYRD